MFEGLFTALRDEGVPVALDEWLMLHDALDRDLHQSTLSGFYLTARSLLVKDESNYDGFDIAFARYFSGIEPATDSVDDRVWKWLRENPKMLQLTDEQRARLDEMRNDMDLSELLEKLQEKLDKQQEEHHGGSEHIGTGGTSAFGHSGYHPGGIRIGGEGRWKSAIQTAGDRQWRDLRTDTEIGVRDFGVALRRLRHLSTRLDGPATEFDIDDTIKQTAAHAGQLRLSFRRPRRNTVRVLLMLDIDHFKSINDAHGHLAGDRVLQAVARCLAGCVRPQDTVARYGGEEFAIVLPDCQLNYGEAVAERIRQTVANLSIAVSPELTLQVTLSVGGAFAPTQARCTPDLWVERADNQLYQAKAQGRNRVYIDHQQVISVSPEEKSLLFGALSTGEPAWSENIPGTEENSAMQKVNP